LNPSPRHPSDSSTRTGYVGRGSGGRATYGLILVCVRGRLQKDAEALEEWFYPCNLPKRDYQLNIVREALFKNTLVALPTGLGAFPRACPLARQRIRPAPYVV
jgi:hypothetical protein